MFDAYETPLVPIRKALLPGQQKTKIRVCGDYSVIVTPPPGEHASSSDAAPRPGEEDTAGVHGGYYSTLQRYIWLKPTTKSAPGSQKKLALRTHGGILHQTRLRDQLGSRPYFPDIMDQLTSDLQGLAAYQEKSLVAVPQSTNIFRIHVLYRSVYGIKGLRRDLKKYSFAQACMDVMPGPHTVT